MAGSYVDVPGRRMAWDADGTVVAFHAGGVPLTDLTGFYAASVLQELNDEDESLPAWGGWIGGREISGQGYFCFVFPELRDIDGFFVRSTTVGGDYNLREVESSADTTNGEDGTWDTIDSTDRPITPTSDKYVSPDYRNDIIAATVNNTSIRGVRFYMDVDTEGTETTFPKCFHIYGNISSGETPDKLIFIDVATGLEFVLPQDWGDVPRGTVHDKTIRIKNNSTGLSATDITLSFEDLYLGSSSWYTIKETAGAYASTLAIPQISPGATYPTSPAVITIRKTVPDDEQLGLHAARLKAHTVTWGTHAYETALTGTATVAAALTAG